VNAIAMTDGWLQISSRFELEPLIDAKDISSGALGTTNATDLKMNIINLQNVFFWRKKQSNLKLLYFFCKPNY
jgi:hypothetical protein